MQTIGFIGTGVMGASMARRLMNAGFPVNVYNRTRSKADALVEAGATWLDSPGEVAAASDVVITIVGYPADVEAVYLESGGIVERAREGAVLIDMTTSRPDLARKIAERATSRRLQSLDAPVSGGDIGAREGRLSIMVGGPKDAFDTMASVFEVMGRNIVWQGEAGAGQHTKMCNQIAIACGMLGVTEALVYAKKSGLDPKVVLKSIESGAAGSWSLSNLAPRVLDEDFAPGFFVKHFIKDVGIAIDSADALGLELPGTALAKKLYETLAANGGENDGTQALIRVYEAGQQVS